MRNVALIILSVYPRHSYGEESIVQPKHVYYRQVSNIRRTLIGNEIVDNSDVVGASPVGAAQTTSSLST